MIHRPDFMIVSGNGRNTGKTSFVEQVIKRNAGNHHITAIKVSPHFHTADKKQDLLAGTEDFTILEEKDISGMKDSSRLLRAGAVKVYYIETKDANLRDALNILLESEDISGPVICESGGMRKLITPSLFIMLTRPDLHENTPSFSSLSAKADIIVNYHDREFDLCPQNIVFSERGWEIREK